VVGQAVRLGNLNRGSMAPGAIPLDLVMLLVATLTGRSAVDQRERYRFDVTGEAGKLMPVVIEADGPRSRRPSRRGYRHFDLVGRRHLVRFMAGRTVAA